MLHLTAGCSVVCRGTLVKSQGKGQAFEIQADEVQVLGFVDDPDTYPIQPKQHTLEFLRDVAHLRARTNTFGAITRVRHRAAQAVHRFFDEEGFFWVNTPIITASDAEGAGQMFRVSTLDAVNPPRTPEGQDRLAQGLLRQGGVPHRLRPAQRGGVLPGDVARSTPSAPPSGRRTPTPRATWPSSG